LEYSRDRHPIAYHRGSDPIDTPVARTFLFAASVCIVAALLEAICAGRSVRQRMTALRRPRYSVPFTGWIVIGGLYYAICFAVLVRLLLASTALRVLAITLFGIVMATNALWNLFFFRTRNLWHAFLVGLAYSVVALVLLFVLSRVDVAAAWCFAPYVIYLFYANVWSYGVWKLNRQSPNKPFL
jgi:tryptophan-rich sensory protein